MKREAGSEKPHKEHRKRRDKVDKKMQYKKNKKKVRAEQQSEKDAQHESSEELIDRTIRTIIKKLLKYEKSSETEIPGLFEVLDKGNEVSIADMEDPYVKHKLYKMFKLMGIPHSARAKYAFRVVKTASTAPRWKSHTLKERIVGMVRDCKEEAKRQAEEKAKKGAEKPGSKSDSDSDSEDESEKKSGKEESDHEPETAHKQAKTEEEPAAKPQPEVPAVAAPKPAKEEEKKKDEHAGKDFLASTMKVLQKDDEEDEMVGPAAPVDAETRRERKMELLAEYNKIFRPKTLLEEHQERMGKMSRHEVSRTKVEKLNDFMYRPFDRKKDIEESRIGSKDAFNVVNGPRNLENKFTSAHFLNDLP